MRRLFLALCLSLTLLASAASTVLADPVPREFLPSQACDNPGRGLEMSSDKSNVPFRHTTGEHGCHVHYPPAYFKNHPVY